MEQFRTIVIPNKHEGLINHERSIFSLGSCFADNIADLLERDLFQVLKNPFGTLYNPASILQTIERLSCPKLFNEEDLFETEGQWRSWDCHTKLGFKDLKSAVNQLNSLIEQSRLFIEKAGTVILTFGTTFVFQLRHSGAIVANCHKMPGSLFERFMLPIEDCISKIEKSINLLRNLNPEIKIIMTVSPIRHLSDGAHGNFLSKATLALAIEKVIEKHEGVFYFPSYEIMMDDLRDYRFYSDDMKHPSKMAIDYIYSRFQESYWNKRTFEITEKARKISLRKEHRFSDDTNPLKYEQFQRITCQMEAELFREYPELKRV